MVSQTCCFGRVPLRTGTLIIAGVWTLLALLGICRLIFAMAVRGPPNEVIADLYGHLLYIYYAHSGARPDPPTYYFYIIFAIAVVLNLVQVVLSGLLFYGALNLNPKPSVCRPWWVYNHYCLFVALIMGTQHLLLVDFLTAAVVAVILNPFCAYLVNMVKNFVKELEDGSSDGKETV